MAIIAKLRISTRDKDGNLKTFMPGETVEGISKAEEKHLLEIDAAKKGE